MGFEDRRIESVLSLYRTENLCGTRNESIVKKRFIAADLFVSRPRQRGVKHSDRGPINDIRQGFFFFFHPWPFAALACAFS